MEKLNESQERLERSLLQGVVVTDAHGIIRSVNDHITRLFGYNKHQLLGKDVKMLMPPALSQQHDEYMAEYRKTGKSNWVPMTTRVVDGLRSDGSLVRVRLSLSFIPGEHPLVCTLLEEMVDRSFVLRTDGSGKILSVEGDPEPVFGLTEEQLTGANVSMLMSSQMAEKHAMFMKHYQGAAKSSIVHKIRNLEARHADSHLFPIALQVTEESAQPLVFGARITEVDGTLEGLMNVDKSGIVVSVSDSCKLLFGYEIAEMVGQPINKFAPTATLAGGQRVELCQHKDGSTFYLSVNVKAVTSEAGETMYHGIVRRVMGQKPARKTSSITDDHIFAGDLLGWYEITKSLGSGYFGTVKMATHRLTKLNVAIKTLKKKQYKEAAMVYPPREIDLIRKLNHPNICRLYDTITTDEAIFMITEVVPGGELFDYVAQKEFLSEDEARDMLRQLVAATDYMHRSGIVHRDLKMENILLDTDGSVKVIDLGLGNFFDGKKLLNTFCGSVREVVVLSPFHGCVLTLAIRRTMRLPSCGRGKSMWAQRWTFGRWAWCCL